METLLVIMCIVGVAIYITIAIALIFPSTGRWLGARYLSLLEETRNFFK